MTEYLENHDITTLKGKRICFISPSAYPLLDASSGGGWSGGAEAQFVTMAKKLSSAGLDVHFIVGDFGQKKKVVINGLTIHRASFRYMGGPARSRSAQRSRQP